MPHWLRQHMGRRAQCGGVLVLDDTSLPKQGRRSAGVARQYCGALGKIANCQSVVTWHWLGATGLHWPLAARLYLPDERTDDPGPMIRAGVPAHAQAFREKWRIALALPDKMKPQLPACQTIVFDAGHGVVRPLLAQLDKRQDPCVAQVPGNIAAWPAQAVATLKPARRGRPRQHAIVRDRAMHPLSMIGWRDKLLQDPKQWAQAPLPRADAASVRAAAVRVRASQRASRWPQPGAARWLLIEQLGEDIFKYYLSSLPSDTPLAELVRLAHQRRAIEQGCQQLKEELRIDHFEGRFWRGLHHHLTLCVLAFCFLTRLRSSKKRPSPPEVHRWLMEALALCTCPRCHTFLTRSGIILDSS